MPLILTLRGASSVPIEVDGLTPTSMTALTPADRERQPVLCGSRTVPLGELFRLDGDCIEDQTLVWRGGCEVVKGIGRSLNSGTVLVEGDVGVPLGLPEEVPLGLAVPEQDQASDVSHRWATR